MCDSSFPTAPLSVETSNQLKKITYIGAGINVSLAIGKLAAGIVGNSTALIADAAHSLSDLLSDVVTMFVLQFSLRSANQMFVKGYGKFESLGTLLLSGILVVTGVGIGMHALRILQEPALELIPTELALGVAFASVIVKEILFQATVKLGKQHSSNLVIANAWHHRADALTSVVAVIGIFGSQMYLPLLDPLAGVIVAGMILRMGVLMGIEAVNELTDKNVPEKHSVLQHIAMNVPGVTHVENIYVYRSGPYYCAEISIQVPLEMNAVQVFEVTEHLRHEILAHEPSIKHISILLHIPNKIKAL